MQHFTADFDSDLFRKRFEGGGGDVHFAIVLTNRTTLQATREAGLVQIADALTETLSERVAQTNAYATS